MPIGRNAAKIQELSAGKAALELKISDLLSKEKMQTTKMAAAEKDLQRSKALTVNLTKELQVIAHEIHSVLVCLHMVIPIDNAQLLMP